ncbi:uncharacterized protein LOC127256834 [Andrographis paniculata]|uniref:uncharacterized protein LOC127256834 n=1 Tax=Andrographis paniculata TaxID=175694 RepID=UPI0021E71023|nr:uncharacterized protein LOC127256834 [Andrographis paniculata]
MPLEQLCAKPSCFFCIMNEKCSSSRKGKLKEYLKGVLYLDDEELILVISGLWNIAMTRPDDEELPLLGVFECLSSLMDKAIRDRAWLLSCQNIYIPYYAAHIIGSYTMNKSKFASRAVDSGVVPYLLELLRGKMSWVEQRVAVRALGHLASYEETFEAIAAYEDELVKLAMRAATTCFDEVYRMFVGVENRRARPTYHCELLTRGVGGVQMENRKAEEWASQIQCWSIHLLSCFAVKGRCFNLLCNQDFLEDLSGMWGGLMNHSSPAGAGLIRILCYTKVGRISVARSNHVVENLCKLARSSDDWQYVGIDCLLLMLKDRVTRYSIIEVTAPYLADLIELESLGSRRNVGEEITRALLYEYYEHQTSKVKDVDVRRTLEEIWEFKVERRRMEKVMSGDEFERIRTIARLIKQEGNFRLSTGETENAVMKYTEALQICPLRYRNERLILYSKRAKGHLLLLNPDAAIRDATRALCLTAPPNANLASLWTRSQAYDMKGMAKESLMDCIMFISACIKSKASPHGVKLPYYAVRMINKQMNATWIFRDAQLKAMKNDHHEDPKEADDYCRSISTNQNSRDRETFRIQVQSKSYISGLSTILEEPFADINGSVRKRLERDNGR